MVVAGTTLDITSFSNTARKHSATTLPPSPPTPNTATCHAECVMQYAEGTPMRVEWEWQATYNSIVMLLCCYVAMLLCCYVPGMLLAVVAESGIL